MLDTIFAIFKRCLAVALQTSKVIEIQNGDQIQIRLVELVLGKIVSSKTKLQDLEKIKIMYLKLSKTSFVGSVAN